MIISLYGENIMLIKFTLENWKSFRDKINFSMIASRERQHRERVTRLSKIRTGVLPIATIYGGNASGKSNLFEAFRFAKRLVVKGSQLDSFIPVEPYRLDSISSKNPTRFSFDLYINEKIYEFSFAVNQTTIIEEKLVEVLSTTEKVLYHRQEGNSDPKFSKTLTKDQVLKVVFNGTRNNQLFLTNSVSQKITTFQPIYDWFKRSLELISPNAVFGSFEKLYDDETGLNQNISKVLSQLDTGISRLGGEKMPIENLFLPGDLVTDLRESIKEGEIAEIHTLEERIHITRLRGGLVSNKLVTFHMREDGIEEKFKFNQESDGTKRLIDILPAFLDLISPDKNRLYIIDEFDRSLHTLLTRALIEKYLNDCSDKSRNQLILITHDAILMDQNILRRDEMWVTERKNSGETDLIPFSDFKEIRFDKDIRKSYLNGRMGGIPNIFIPDGFDIIN